MSEFKVGDRVITRLDDVAYSRFNLPYDAVPDGEHTITEIYGDACRLAGYPNWWYPLDNMTKVDNAPAVKDDDSIFRDECAMRAMQAFISGGDVRDNMFLSDPKGRELTQWLSEDSYAYADAMIKARKK